MTNTSDIVLPDDPSFGPEVQPYLSGLRRDALRAPKRPLVTVPEELHRSPARSSATTRCSRRTPT